MIIIAFFSFSCKGNQDDQFFLQEVESIISESPDSALMLLMNHDRSLMNSQYGKAKHALLHSIALDKNYIDLKSDSIISPAVSYFRKLGSSEEKLKTLYYLGRVYQNAGDDESAMDCFVKALRFDTSVSDPLSLARCWSAIGIIYKNTYELEKSIEANEKAATLFLSSDNINGYVNNVLKSANCWESLNDFDAMGNCIEKVKQYINDISDNTRGYYYATVVKYYMALGNQEKTVNVVKEYTDSIGCDIVSWKIVAYALLKSERTEEAMEAIMKYKSRDAGFYSVRAEINESIGDYSSALSDYKKYIHLSDSIDMVNYASNVRFIQERYEKDMDIMRGKTKMFIISIFSVLLLFLLARMIVVVNKYRHDKRMLKNLVTTMEKERESLMKIVHSMPAMDPEINTVLSARLELLNNILFMSKRSSGLRLDEAVKSKIDELVGDTKEYLSTVGMTYVISNPEFVVYLKSKGLAAWEIGYCCLYIMGFNAKEISGFMLNNQVYKISGSIRKKLGIEGRKVRFETWIMNLYKEKNTKGRILF